MHFLGGEFLAIIIIIIFENQNFKISANPKVFYSVHFNLLENIIYIQ